MFLKDTGKYFEDYEQYSLLKDSETYYITFTLQAKDEYIKIFSDSLSNSTYLTQPVCVFFDSSLQTWSRSGVSTASYDYTTGILNCSTSHLSEFTMDYELVVVIGNTTEDSNYYFKKTD